jgi:hypothetical protein
VSLLKYRFVLSLQFDESTDVSGPELLLVFAIYLFQNKTEEDLLFNYKHCLRLDGPPFDELLQTVTSTISNRNTNTRGVVTPSQCLSTTLRYLATVNTSHLKFSLLSYL